MNTKTYSEMFIREYGHRLRYVKVQEQWRFVDRDGEVEMVPDEVVAVYILKSLEANMPAQKPRDRKQEVYPPVYMVHRVLEQARVALS